MKWLEQTPWWVLAIAALMLALTPFGAPHLPEKLRMLFGGTLRRPLDWFDLFLHSAPLLLLAAKGVLFIRRKSSGAGAAP